MDRIVTGKEFGPGDLDRRVVVVVGDDPDERDVLEVERIGSRLVLYVRGE